MKLNKEMNRRNFLKVSAASGTGLLIGFNWLTGCTPSTPEMSIPKDWTDINAFIKIADNGLVTIFSPNPEIGQNVKTAMPMIVAEELDVDWKKVIVEQADLNTIKYNRQIAGGSQSIRAGWDGLRQAGATGRQMLRQAAANQWNVSLDQVSTDQGQLINTKTKEKIGYGDVAVAAASLPVPESVTLKDPKDFKLIGTKVKNVDGPKIIKGEPLFGIDYQKEGQVIAMLIHAPAFGMKLKSFDAEKAKAMPGIEDVFVIDTTLEKPNWSDVNAFNELIVITGATTWQVMKAKKAISAEWESTGKLENSEDHLQSLISAVDGEKGETLRQDGDPLAMRGKAAKVVEKTYTAPFLAHNTMEPMNFFAHVTPEKAELVGPIQTPESLRSSVMAALGMSEEQVSVQMTRMGGGFGRRLYGNFGLEAALISKKAGKPVKLVYTREDDMTQGTYRPAYRVKYTATLDENNNLTSFTAKAAGLPESPLFANRFPAGTLDHYRAEGIRLDTNISTGAWRAPRSNFIAGAEQSFLDEVAEAAGKDPIDLRLELFDRAMKNPVGENNDYDAARYAGVLKLVREKSNWDQETPGVYRGVSAYYCHNSYVAQVVDVIKKDGEPVIQKVWCAVDCGIVVNYEGAINQVEGGIIDGIGHAMYSQLTFKNGKPEQENFHQYELIRHTQAPEIEVFFAQNGEHPTGLGEPSLPPVMGAVANALYKATGTRYYNQPYMKAQQANEIYTG
ncbi:xanthine dehydrogenase family protein molybdopterin-binding subunit [Algoriphagus namhaensis]